LELDETHLGKEFGNASVEEVANKFVEE